VLRDGRLFVANVGDSRSVLAEKDSKNHYSAIRITTDDSVDLFKEQQRVRKYGGIVEKGRVRVGNHAINMTRALGDFDFKAPYNKAEGDFISPVPHIMEVQLTPRNEFLVLATDGLWNTWEDQEVVDRIAVMKREGLSPTQICEQLVKPIQNRPTADNTTVILIFFKWHTEGVTTVTAHKLRVEVDPLYKEVRKEEDATIVEKLV